MKYIQFSGETAHLIQPVPLLKSQIASVPQSLAHFNVFHTFV